MIFKIIVSILIGIYYLCFIISKIHKNNDKELIKTLSLSLLIVYIIFLLLIWKVV